VAGTGNPGEHAGVLRIHFHAAGEEEERFDRLDWDEFFEKFEEEGLAFLHQRFTADGEVSRFHKFVRR
jgi:hypothetical protein